MNIVLQTFICGTIHVPFMGLTVMSADAYKNTGYIQTALVTCCLGRKHINLVLFWKIFNSYIYVSVDYETINNSGKYFTCRVCNLEKYSDKTVKGNIKS